MTVVVCGSLVILSAVTILFELDMYHNMSMLHVMTNVRSQRVGEQYKVFQI